MADEPYKMTVGEAVMLYRHGAKRGPQKDTSDRRTFWHGPIRSRR